MTLIIVYMDSLFWFGQVKAKTERTHSHSRRDVTWLCVVRANHTHRDYIPSVRVHPYSPAAGLFFPSTSSSCCLVETRVCDERLLLFWLANGN